MEAALRDEGRANVAEEVAISRRDRELREDGAWYERALGFVHRWTVWYGHKPEWSVYWIVGLIVLGWIVGSRLLRTEKGRSLGVGSPLLFSIDRLLPLVTLREAYAEVDIEEMPRRFQFYFGFHVFAGYALAAALVTAFSGLAGG